MKSFLDPETGRFYSREAHGLRMRYAVDDDGRREEMFRCFSDCSRILDVGCGTGRDLAFLLRKGKDAVGVEAVTEMVEASRETLREQRLDSTGRVFQSALPDLGLFQDGEFDGVLCSAVLMHLQEEVLFDAVYSLRRVLRQRGKLLISIPERRTDVDPVTRRDQEGRLFTDLPPSRLQLLLERIGFSVERVSSSEDSLGRAGVTWWTGEFRRMDDGAERPLHLVESILSRDKKDATYKLALFRALADIAQTQTHLAVYLPEARVKIPLGAIAEKWILYYWPIVANDVFIPQRTNEVENGRLGVAIRAPLKALVDYFAGSGGLTGFYCDWRSGRLSSVAERLFRAARRQFQQTIHSMPARHAGGGHYSVFQYDPLDKSLVMDVKLWRELCLMGSWIRDATILRWAEQTEIFSKGMVKASAVIDCLLLAPDQGRNVNDARNYFRSLGMRVCVWSDKSLPATRFDVDHAMPFSYWRNNDLWNLFPADPGINAQKSDRLPTYAQLRSSQDRIVDCWWGLSDSMGARFEREAQTLLGRATFRRGNWEALLFTRFVEAFETTAAQRGAERWEAPNVTVRTSSSSATRIPPSAVRYPAAEEGLQIPRVHEPQERPADSGKIVPFSEVRERAFVTCLPLVGSLAAGAPFHGLETGSLADLEGLDWVEVGSKHARRNRFVVRVAGDSMEPTFHLGDLLVFEYHRSPRLDRQIVIANLPEFGSGHEGVEAIKRISQAKEAWRFLSDNPAYAPLTVPRTATDHPILGTFVAKVGSSSSDSGQRTRCSD